MQDAKTLGKYFGLIYTDSAFWNSSLDVIRGQIREFESLVA
jgi:oligoendopeptidase F